MFKIIYQNKILIRIYQNHNSFITFLQDSFSYESYPKTGAVTWRTMSAPVFNFLIPAFLFLSQNTAPETEPVP